MSINNYFLRQSDGRLRNKNPTSDTAEASNSEANNDVNVSVVASDNEAIDPAL